MEPGAETAVSLTVLNANGQPVPNAEVALFVVDEAILALTNYQLANPLDAFYQPLWGWLDSRYGRSSILLVNPQTLADAVDRAAPALDQVKEMPMAEEETMLDAAAAPAEGGIAMATPAPSPQGPAAPNTPIDVRTDFNPLAVFAPAVSTNAQGNAEVTFKLPDNLTRYRIMAVAVAGDNQFGIGEENLTARLPLMVRPSAPASSTLAICLSCPS
ncbi:MAG: hypothetical protein M5U34_16975 [Chloroflexi bacterium]|nr:hypothetical protein [Chloroflexota bacterium]